MPFNILPLGFPGGLGGASSLRPDCWAAVGGRRTPRWSSGPSIHQRQPEIQFPVLEFLICSVEHHRPIVNTVSENMPKHKKANQDQGNQAPEPPCSPDLAWGEAELHPLAISGSLWVLPGVHWPLRFPLWLLLGSHCHGSSQGSWLFSCPERRIHQTGAVGPVPRPDRHRDLIMTASRNCKPPFRLTVP